MLREDFLRTTWTGGRFSMMRGSLSNLSRASLYVMLAARCFIMSFDAFLDLGFNKNILWHKFLLLSSIIQESICCCPTVTLALGNIHRLYELLPGCFYGFSDAYSSCAVQHVASKKGVSIILWSLDILRFEKLVGRSK